VRVACHGINSFLQAVPDRGLCEVTRKAAAGPVNHRPVLRNGGELRRRAAKLAGAVSFSTGH